MSVRHFLDRVAERAGLRNRGEAMQAVRAVLPALGGSLGAGDAQALAAELPGELGGLVLQREGPGPSAPLAALVAHVANEERIGRSFALEHLEVVFEALAEQVPEPVIARTRRVLAEDVADRLVRPAPVPGAPPHLRPERRTLAEGRPGGRHPLYAAKPDRAQTHSVARSANPHEDTKLSSARGLTQEREDETLASSPGGGSGTPLHGGH
jgi:uncharacterized protein (DUF2267 family)